MSKVIIKIKTEMNHVYENIDKIRENLYIAASLTTSMKINKYEIKTLIDSGAKVFVMIMNLTEQLKLFIFYIFKLSILNIIRKIKEFYNLCEDVSIVIRNIIYKVFI